MFFFYHPVIHSTVTNFFSEEKKYSFILKSSFMIKLDICYGTSLSVPCGMS